MNRKATFQVWLLGLTRIPLILFCRPRVIEVRAERSVIRIPLRRRTRNHLGSMYIASFTVGADLAAGLLAFNHSRIKGRNTSISFKSMQANYIKRAMSHVDFICEKGAEVAALIDAAALDGERKNLDVPVTAYCENEIVAQISIELSVKVKLPG